MIQIFVEALEVIVIFIGNGIKKPSSNPGHCSLIHFTWIEFLMPRIKSTAVPGILAPLIIQFIFFLQKVSIYRFC